MRVLRHSVMVSRHTVRGFRRGVPSQCDARAPHSVREIRLSVMTLGWSASLGW